jgi:hypothetical protein
MKTVCVLTDVWEDIQPAGLPSETLHDPHWTPSTPLCRVPQEVYKQLTAQSAPKGERL